MRGSANANYGNRVFNRLELFEYGRPMLIDFIQATDATIMARSTLPRARCAGTSVLGVGQSSFVKALRLSMS
jgi:hypothetical protein